MVGRREGSNGKETGKTTTAMNEATNDPLKLWPLISDTRETLDHLTQLDVGAYTVHLIDCLDRATVAGSDGEVRRGSLFWFELETKRGPSERSLL